MNQLYKLNLHETIKIPDINANITRVPGGWIYRLPISETDDAAVFVPYCEDMYELGSRYKERFISYKSRNDAIKQWKLRNEVQE